MRCSELVKLGIRGFTIPLVDLNVDTVNMSPRGPGCPLSVNVHSLVGYIF